MQYAEQLLDKYQKVALLAERGDAGEKANATRLKTKMESKYPGIGYQSQLRARQQEERERAKQDSHGAGNSNGNFGGAYQQEPRWQKWTSMAESAFSWASEVAGEVANVDYARRCAEQLVDIKAKNLTSAKFQVAAQITLKDMYSMGHHLSRAQKQVFAQMVGAKVASAVLEALEDA